MTRIAFDGDALFHELGAWCEDEDFLAAVKRCIDAQRDAAREVFEREFRPRPDAARQVDEEALHEILRAERDVHGISRDRSISNVIAFNARNLADAVHSAEVARLRAVVDEEVRRRVREVFEDGAGLAVAPSGHFWYPPGSWMGWHTNSQAPGWRLYVSHAEEPGRSFFRWRHPRTHEIVTSRDAAWDVRLFRVSRERPLWHAVLSDTHRFSLGYVVFREPRRRSLARRIRAALRPRRA